MGRLFIGVVAAIALLTAGALLLVHRLTEPLTPGSKSGQGAAAPAGWSAPGPQPPADRGPPIAAPAVTEAPRAVPVESTATQPTPPDAPAEAAAEEEESQPRERNQRGASPSEKLNKRLRQRGGAPQQGQE